MTFIGVMAKVIAPFWFVRRTNQCKGQGAGPLRGSRGAEPRVGLGETQHSPRPSQTEPNRAKRKWFATSRRDGCRDGSWRFTGNYELVRSAVVASVRIEDAAAGDAAVTRGAGGLALLPTLLNAHRADLFVATGRQLRLSDTNFARVARIDARLHLRAGLAFRRIVDRIAIAAPRAGRIFRTEPYRVIDSRKLAAAEAIAAVGRERSAITEAILRLHRECLRARPAISRNTGARIVRALAAFRRVIRRDLERVALVAPVAIIVSSARVLIEVAIGLARRIVLPGNTTIEAVFGVIARSETLAVL